jgi:CubicO group peptidase (beta-lactamase class C family)
MADMTSDLDSYTEDKQWVSEWLADPHRVWKPEELTRIGIKESPLFDPGSEWFYSNTNYVLLGLVLEPVTGKPIAQLYQKEITNLSTSRRPPSQARTPLLRSPTTTATPSKDDPPDRSPRLHPLESLRGMDGRPDDLQGR